MAIQAGGFLGGFSGRLGPAIGYMWNGRWCLRSRPTQVRNPRTEAQVAHRTAFKAEVQLAARMRQAVVATFTDQSRTMGMTAFNLFVNLNQPCFALEAGSLQVDWARLRLSTGPVAPVALGAARVEEGNVLEVAFERNPLGLRADAYDGVHLYVYAPAVGEGFLAAYVHRRDRRVRVCLPQGLAGHEVHLFAMVEDSHGRWSETAYGGSLVLEPQNEINENNDNDGKETVLFDRRSERTGGGTPVGAALLGDGVRQPAAGEEQAGRAVVHRARHRAGEAYPLPDA